MNIDIKGVHYDVSDATRNFIAQKIEKLKYAEDLILNLHFTLSKGSKDWSAEIMASFRWGASAHMKETAFNLHEALEKLIDKFDMKVSKEKQKVQDHHQGDESLKPVEE